MDVGEFERLLSEWVDAPQRTDLRARIDAAARECPRLACLRDQWLRVARLSRQPPAAVRAVNWARLRRRIIGPLNGDPADKSGPS